MDPMNYMENIATAHYCGHCKRKLPLDAFYFIKRNQRFDHYCKECRKASSRKHYNTAEQAEDITVDRDYPVITRTEDPEKRLELILHAWQVVVASAARKWKKRWEEEDKEESMIEGNE